MPVTDDRGVGPRPMAYRKRERLIECIDCRWSTTVPEGITVTREDRGRDAPIYRSDPPVRAATEHRRATGHRLSTRVRDKLPTTTALQQEKNR